LSAAAMSRRVVAPDFWISRANFTPHTWLHVLTQRTIKSGIYGYRKKCRLETVAAAPLRVRVGIATGLVVVGDLIGEGEARERGIVGKTPNLAARLQAIAPEDGVLIAEATRRLLGDLFEYRDLGAVATKGFDAAVPVFEVLRSSAVENRFEVLRAAVLTPLVGCAEELMLLRRRWEQAKTGEGSIVLISGEPGIGKSRPAETRVQKIARSISLFKT
jgi:hypothetical protein